MALIQNLIPSSKYNIKCPYAMSPVGVAIHNTANDASAVNEIAYMHRNDMEVSFHIAVDDQQAIQGIPFSRNTWHAGDGNGAGNRSYISLEICYSKSGGPRFEAAERRAAKEVALLLKQYNWTIENIKDHRYFSGKNCPHRTNMDKFKRMVQEELGNTGTVPAAIKAGSRVRISGSYYYTGQSIPSWVKAQEHTVKQVSGEKALLQEINSWVYLKDLQSVAAAATIQVGTTVRVTGSNYATGQVIPQWVKESRYTVVQLSGEKALLSTINSWVYIKDLAAV